MSPGGRRLAVALGTCGVVAALAPAADRSSAAALTGASRPTIHAPPVAAQPLAAATPLPTQPVDWPDVPEAEELDVWATTRYAEVSVAEASDPLVASAERWTPHIDSLVTLLSVRLGRVPPREPYRVIFAPAYEASCPARGLAYRDEGGVVLTVFIDEATSDEQVRAVLAHELTHALTFDDEFVGDGVLTEGVANWAPGGLTLAWQGIEDWSDDVRRRVADGSYVSVADPAALGPAPGEDCIARRDRVYNMRAAFTAWLVKRIGREVVLSMPARHIRVAPEGAGEATRRVEPDYEAATGFDLKQLESIWLAELTGRT